MFNHHPARSEPTFYRRPGRRVLWVLQVLFLTGILSLTLHAQDRVPVDLHVSAPSRPPAAEPLCSGERRGWVKPYIMTTLRVSCHKSQWLPAEAPLQLSGSVGAKVLVGRHTVIVPEVHMRSGMVYAKVRMEVRLVF